MLLVPSTHASRSLIARGGGWPSTLRGPPKEKGRLPEQISGGVFASTSGRSSASKLPRVGGIEDAKARIYRPKRHVFRACFRYVAARGKSVIVGYCRIGPLEPIERLDTQRSDLAAIGAQEYFCEKASVFGKMPELERAIEFARKGDVIAITKPYRVARSTRAVLALIERLGRKGVGLRILGTPIDTSTTTGRMILGSAPLWSLGASPLRSVLWDLSIGWWRGR